MDLKKLNPRELGKQKDREILELLELLHFMKREHIELLFYSSANQKERLSRRKMASLVTRGLVKRRQPSRDSSNIYYLKSWNDKAYHWLGITDAYIWFTNKSKGKKLKHFKPEVRDLTIVQPDAYCQDFNCFIEVDLSTNPFIPKIAKYEALAKGEEWQEKGYFRKAPEVEGVSDFIFPFLMVFTNRQEIVKGALEKSIFKRWQVEGLKCL